MLSNSKLFKIDGMCTFVVAKNVRKFEFNISTSLKQMKVSLCWVGNNLPGIYHLKEYIMVCLDEKSPFLP